MNLAVVSDAFAGRTGFVIPRKYAAASFLRALLCVPGGKKAHFGP